MSSKTAQYDNALRLKGNLVYSTANHDSTEMWKQNIWPSQTSTSDR